MAKGLRPFDSDRPVRIHQSRLLCALQTFGKASDPLIILTPRREDVRLLRRELTPFYPDQAMRELYPLGLIMVKSIHAMKRSWQNGQLPLR